MRLLVFGYGDCGARLAARLMTQGWSVAATSRSARGRAAIAATGAEPIDPADPQAVAHGAASASAILVAAPPDETGCPGLRALGPSLAGRADPASVWTGYLSTTGVYGDRGGGWAFERDPPAPASPQAHLRAAAEQAWGDAGHAKGLAVSIFRLPGIYGPGRSALDRLRAGDLTRTHKPGQVFSRVHVDDVAAGLAASIARPERAGVYNLCDDEPAGSDVVTTYAAGLLGVDLPPARAFDAQVLSPAAQRFWAESRRVSNARAKAALGWRPVFPTYREGLSAILDGERSSCA